MKKYDNYVIGQIQVDYDEYPDGTVRTLIGGPFMFTAYAAISSGWHVSGVCKIAEKDAYLAQAVYIHDLTVLPSRETTSLHVIYHSEDRERRSTVLKGIADPVTAEDIPDNIESEVYQLAGVMRGQVDNGLFEYLSKRGKLACDLQGFLRCPDGDKLTYQDWEEKKKYLPCVTYLKLDAMEAEITTGLTDRREAAKMIHSWGPKEVLITHNSEALVYDGDKFYTCPLRPRNLSGRSGRGDSTFGSYITERSRRTIPESLLYASALVSLKMETYGAFRQTRRDVEEYIKQFYAEYC